MNYSTVFSFLIHVNNTSGSRMVTKTNSIKRLCQLPQQTSTRAARVLRRTSGSHIQTLRRLSVRPLDDVHTTTPWSSCCCSWVTAPTKTWLHTDNSATLLLTQFLSATVHRNAAASDTWWHDFLFFSGIPDLLQACCGVCATTWLSPTFGSAVGRLLQSAAGSPKQNSCR